MLGLLLVFTLLVLLLHDLWLLCCRQRVKHTAVSKRILWGLLVVDLLPILLVLSYQFDNTPSMMRLSMWIIWLWITILFSRLCHGLFTWLKLRRLAGVMTALVALTFIYGAAIGRKALRVEEVTVCSDRVSTAFDGYRIAFFSDLHLGALVNTRQEVGQVVEAINRLNPDIVLFGGDLVNIRYTELDSTASALLQQIQVPVYSVIGNHDVGTYIADSTALPFAISHQRLIERQEMMGWTVLQDTTLYLHRGADSISLSGFSYNATFKNLRHVRGLPMSGREKGYRNVPTDCYNITLIHVPQHWEEIKQLGYGDLTLSGHTHAMQCKLRLNTGHGISPARLIYREWSGRYEDNRHTLYINDGIGYVVYPMRIGARPEVTLITLKQCE